MKIEDSITVETFDAIRANTEEELISIGKDILKPDNQYEVVYYEDKKKYSYPWWRRWYRNWRCPEAGIAYLEWAMTLTNEEFLEDGEKHLAEPTYQAKAAREILELYRWWKDVYPKRPDVHDASGWTSYCNLRREKGYHLLDMEDKTAEEAEMCKTALDKSRELEAQYEQEDEEMMIRLIKVRQSLWT